MENLSSLSPAILRPPTLLMFSEVHVMRLVLLRQFFRHESLAYTPDEIHLGVRGAERQPRFKNQKHAAIEKKTSSDQAQHDRNPTIARAGNRHQPDGHAGSHKHA